LPLLLPPRSTLSPYTPLFRSVKLESVTAGSIATTTIATVTPLLIGREMRTRRERAEELRRQVENAEKERLESARRAVEEERARIDRKSTRLNSSHVKISYAVF